VLKRPVATVPGVSGGRVLLPDQQRARGERGSITLAVAPGAPENCVKSGDALLISERADHGFAAIFRVAGVVYCGQSDGRRRNGGVYRAGGERSGERGSATLAIARSPRDPLQIAFISAFSRFCNRSPPFFRVARVVAGSRSRGLRRQYSIGRIGAERRGERVRRALDSKPDGWKTVFQK
jgi:hypothetical protein